MRELLKKVIYVTNDLSQIITVSIHCILEVKFSSSKTNSSQYLQMKYLHSQNVIIIYIV